MWRKQKQEKNQKVFLESFLTECSGLPKELPYVADAVVICTYQSVYEKPKIEIIYIDTEWKTFKFGDDT